MGLRFDGRGVQAARKLRGWTLRDLSFWSGLSNPYLSQLETGKMRNPGINAVIALSRAFGCSVVSLLTTRPLYHARTPKGRPR